MSFPWSKEDAPARKGKKIHSNNAASNIFGSEPIQQRRKPLAPAQYNIISGDGSSANASDRQPKKAVYNPSDYRVEIGTGAVGTAGENPFAQNQRGNQKSRFQRAPKCGDFDNQQSNNAYKSNRQNAEALRVRTQTSEAGACIFGK